MSVILQPYSNNRARVNYQHTIESLVPIGGLIDIVEPNVFVQLQAIYPNGDAAVWGVMPNNAELFESVQAGDIVLFARDGGFFTRARITFKLQSKPLAQHLWGDADGVTWENLYFLDEVAPINISYVDFNQVVGYQPNAPVQGFRVLNNVQSERVLQYENLGKRIFEVYSR